jgi:hypothetical protein
VPGATVSAAPKPRVTATISMIPAARALRAGKIKPAQAACSGRADPRSRSRSAGYPRHGAAHLRSASGGTGSRPLSSHLLAEVEMTAIQEASSTKDGCRSRDRWPTFTQYIVDSGCQLRIGQFGVGPARFQPCNGEPLGELEPGRDQDESSCGGAGFQLGNHSTTARRVAVLDGRSCSGDRLAHAEMPDFVGYGEKALSFMSQSRDRQVRRVDRR